MLAALRLRSARLTRSSHRSNAVAHEAAEPSDVYHHVLEHRRSWGNVLRRLVALSALLLVLGGASWAGPASAARWHRQRGGDNDASSNTPTPQLILL